MSALDATLDDVFRALADPSRRLLLDSLNAHGGQTLGELCAQLDMARQSVSKHLAVLENSQLVTTVRQGRQKLHYLNAEPINRIAERWIDRYSRERMEALADLRRVLEEPMSRPEFVYTTYIRTTPERLWEALTNPVFARRYLGMGLVTDWKIGSPYVWDEDRLRIESPEQVVLDYDPYRRLAFTFHTFTPEVQQHTGLDDATFAAAAAEPRSRVAFELEPHEDQVRLTVIHDGFDPDSAVLRMVTNGWPLKLSDLKSSLESPAASAVAAGRK
ncbi:MULTISPECIES: metalloregulator ArsR/SmtB family transcription factor [Frankia]|uniref:Metalloregulator ArsR/SmtB family transcription factor n=1 Tax=Frankia umida TaxID=573489 RepID=A0ABT0JYY7_9ACTN|nr:MULTISPECIES: metalloregulator ArsR/SmtB family transcription factor [Frankia]MCK9876767.1 metalloregulator ArsR/SmtB family transcription factor [Frankia umida]